MAQTGAHGSMDITDQKSTFDAFVRATVWTCGLFAQIVALLTLAFAIGAAVGWLCCVCADWRGGWHCLLSGVLDGKAALWAVMVLGGLIVRCWPVRRVDPENRRPKGNRT